MCYSKPIIVASSYHFNPYFLLLCNKKLAMWPCHGHFDLIAPAKGRCAKKQLQTLLFIATIILPGNRYPVKALLHFPWFPAYFANKSTKNQRKFLTFYPFSLADPSFYCMVPVVSPFKICYDDKNFHHPVRRSFPCQCAPLPSSAFP